MTHTPTRPARGRALLGAALPVLALAALGPLACKDTLPTAAQPQGTLNSTTLANQAGVEGTLVGAYRALDANGPVLNWGNAASDWVFASTTSDDALKGSTSGDQPGIQDLDLYAWQTGNADDYLNNKWNGAYEGVSRANATLNLLKTVQQAGGISAADAASIAGEAIFLRAHFHFSAYRVFGNIPYYREDVTDFRQPNIPAAQVLTEIIKDLDSAAVLLPSTPRNGDKARAFKSTALAYKGRVQAYAGQWPEALQTLRAVQASGVYALESSYDKVWTGRPAFWNGKETILAYQASVNDGDPNGNNANYGERLNFPHSGSPFNCCGFHQPSQNLVNYFRVDANGLPLALSSPTTWNSNDSAFFGGNQAPVDPRLDWTVGRDGTPYKDWGLPNSSWNRDRSYSGPYSPKKNVHEQVSVGTSQSTVGWTPQQLNAVKMHIFRYADMLLLLAEAEVEAGSTENARQIVNQIRARAAAGAQGCGTSDSSVVKAYPSCQGNNQLSVPVGDPSVTWANYQVGQYPAGAFADQSFAREAVHAERRLELAMEGQRFFDLRRWGTYQTVLNNYVATERNRFPRYFTGIAPVAQRHQFYPIPSVQIALSSKDGTPQLKQNPGW